MNRFLFGMAITLGFAIGGTALHEPLKSIILPIACTIGIIIAFSGLMNHNKKQDETPNKDKEYGHS